MVKDGLDFFFNYPKLIGQSSHIITSFGMGVPELNAMIKALPNSTYIFLEHGVTFFKKSVLNLYNSDYFDRILVPSRRTKDIYDKDRLWPREKMLLAGLPRWDLLCRRQHFQKNIFVFFTWRRSFYENKKAVKDYFAVIVSLLNKLAVVCEENDVKINIALHHQILYSGIRLPEFDGLNIINPNEISKYIGDADLLITDYSSICFDFMYLDIPVVFCRFNFHGKADDDHNDVDFAKDDFLYNCCHSEEQVLARIKCYLGNGFVLEPENVEKNDRFFWDKSNIREAVYREIIKDT